MVIPWVGKGLTGTVLLYAAIIYPADALTIGSLASLKVCDDRLVSLVPSGIESNPTNCCDVLIIRL